MSLAAGFACLSLLVAAAFVASVAWANRLSPSTAVSLPLATLCTVLWLALTGAVAGFGLLRFWPPPPTMFLLLLVAVAGVAWIVRSRLGAHLADSLPLWCLVGFQVFRVVVELLLHQAFVEGHIGIQMTYLGRNLDIVSGITGLLLGFVLRLRTVHPYLVLAWNAIGLALLINIVTIAILSADTPFRYFTDGPANTFVTRVPFVWLPAVLVQAALLGHLLVFRRLIAPRSTD